MAIQTQDINPNQKQTPKLPGVKNIIAVASGKGGVGKSTVASNLACALNRQGYKVGVLDADIYGPSQHIMLGLIDAAPDLDKNKNIIPLKKDGMEIISFGFFTHPNEAVVWRGPMIARLFTQFIDDVKWGELDYLVVDLPPGTGDIQLTLAQNLQVTGVVIVTTPQKVAIADAIKGVNMFRKVNIEVLGIIENMSTFECPHCHKETHIFSKEGGRIYATELKVPFLGELPLEIATRDASDSGTPITALKPESAQAKRFLKIAEDVVMNATDAKSRLPQTESSIPQPSPHHVHEHKRAVNDGFEV